MRRLALLAVFVVLIGEFGWAGAVLDVAVFAVVLFRSLKRHPLKDCAWCGGSKGHRDVIWSAAFGKCLFCKGSGVAPRAAVRVFRPKTAGDIRAGRHGRYH